MSGENDIKGVQEKLDQGYLILNAFLTENRNLPTSELFQQCWKLILRNEVLFRGAQTWGNRFSGNSKNIVYVRFALFFKHLRADFVPAVKLADESGDFSACPGSIFVSFHSELELAIAKLLQGNSHDLSMISSAPRKPKMIELFNLSPLPRIIKGNSNCFLLAREALMGASSLIFDVDYAVFDEGQQRFVHKISISGFSFAKKVLRPLYFVKPEINVDGEIVCTIRLSQTEESAHGIAEQFISFMGSKAIPGHEILIGDWFSDISGKSNARIAR